MVEINSALQIAIESIEAFPDAEEAIALLQEHGIATAIRINLAYRYGSAVKRQHPELDTYAFNYELGVTKPDPAMYRVARARILEQRLANCSGKVHPR